MPENILTIEKPQGNHDALSPCPFCACVSPLYIQYNHAAGPRWMVFCPDCSASLDPGYAQDKYTVRTKWNRRNGK